MRTTWAIAALPILTPLLLATACKPPATDEMGMRERLDDRAFASAPIESPDTTGALWAPSDDGERILYGRPGEQALFALACRETDGGKLVEYTRLADADEEAKAVLSLIGNSHVARIKVDAVERGARWVWRGSVPVHSPDLEALTGPREVEATIPGAGSLILNPSPIPGLFIAECRGFATS